jgi:hypothetical protein
MKIVAVLVLPLISGFLFCDSATAEEVLNMRSIQEMCGPKWGHHDFVDQTE